MSNIFRELLFKLDVIAPFIILLIVLIRVLTKSGAEALLNWILPGFILLQLILNAVAGYLQSREINNLFVYRANCLLTHFLFSYYFIKVLPRKWIVAVGFSLFIGIEIFLMFHKQTYFYKNVVYTAFPSYSFAASSFLLSIYALTLLNVVLEKKPTVYIFSLKEFWLITGILTYFGSSFFIFVSYQYLSQVSGDSVFILWQVHNIFLTFGCVILSKAITSKQWIRE